MACAREGGSRSFVSSVREGRWLARGQAKTRRTAWTSSVQQYHHITSLHFISFHLEHRIHPSLQGRKDSDSCLAVVYVWSAWASHFNSTQSTFEALHSTAQHGRRVGSLVARHRRSLYL